MKLLMSSNLDSEQDDTLSCIISRKAYLFYVKLHMLLVAYNDHRTDCHFTFDTRVTTKLIPYIPHILHHSRLDAHVQMVLLSHFSQVIFWR